MNFKSLLIFDLDGARFAVDTASVRESLWLPELTPVEEAPPWIVGLFSLREKIVPVTDLRQHFGRTSPGYSTSDQVIVMETEHALTGIIVSAVIGVIELADTAIQPPPQFGTSTRAPFAHLVAGEVRMNDGLATLIDISRLPHLLEEMLSAEHPAPANYFCPRATPDERALFHARAATLRNAIAEENGDRLALAVVELGGEFFGIELASVLEFCNITQLRSIPCCPPHILGTMNLRGELITLIDPRAALDLPDAEKGKKAIVASFENQAVGIAVNEVLDVVYLKSGEVLPSPALLGERHGTEISGTAPYSGRMMTVLNLPALLAKEEWIVDEEA